MNRGSSDTVKDNTPSTVTVTPSPGYYKNSLQVSLKINKPGTIYYTLNGSTPTNQSTPYTESISITKTTTLKFITVDNEGNTSPVQTKIYTIDTVKPVISSTDPKNGATNVATSKIIKVIFNENIKKGSNLIELKNSKGKTIPFTTAISGKVLTIKPTNNLSESLYTLVIHSGTVTDLAGNPVSAKSTKFSTGTPPTVKSTDPKNGATKVVANKPIKVTFNENIKKGSKFWVELKNSTGKTIFFSTSVSGKVLTIKTKNKLAESKYKLTLHTGCVTDLAGNPLAGKTTTFSTGTPPKVTRTDPKNNAENIIRNKKISVTFSENIKAGNYRIELVNSKSKKITIKKSIKGKVLVITHAKLSANSRYTLKLYSASVTDKAGNPLAAKSIKFTTRKT